MREYAGDDPLAFVVSLNVKRRQLTASQLAFVALEIEKAEARLAKARQGMRMDILAILPECSGRGSKGNARDKAAAAVGVSGRYVQDTSWRVQLFQSRKGWSGRPESHRAKLPYPTLWQNCPKVAREYRPSSGRY